jgi:hypothetical protein
VAAREVLGSAKNYGGVAYKDVHLFSRLLVQESEWNIRYKSGNFWHDSALETGSAAAIADHRDVSAMILC